MEHKSPTRMCHLTLFSVEPFASFHKRCSSPTLPFSCSPGVLRSPFFSLPLWVPLQCYLDYMSIWSPQCVADPSPSSLSDLLLYWPLPICLQSSLLLIFLGHQICKMFLMLLVMNTYNFCCNLSVNLKVSEHTRASPSHLTQRLSALSWLLVRWIAILVSAMQIPLLPFQILPE